MYIPKEHAQPYDLRGYLDAKGFKGAQLRHLTKEEVIEIKKVFKLAVPYAGSVEKCGNLNSRSRKVCAKPKGWNTDHPGYGPCARHGGMFPSTRLKCAGDQMRHMAKPVVGQDPMQALLDLVAIHSGEVVYCSHRIAELEETNLTEVFGEDGGLGETQNIWIKTRWKAAENLAKVSKMALDAGVQERQIERAERMGDALAAVMTSVFDELELTEDQKKRAAVTLRQQLVLMEAGQSQVIET